MPNNVPEVSPSFNEASPQQLKINRATETYALRRAELEQANVQYQSLQSVFFRAQQEAMTANRAFIAAQNEYLECLNYAGQNE